MKWLQGMLCLQGLCNSLKPSLSFRYLVAELASVNMKIKLDVKSLERYKAIE